MARRNATPEELKNATTWWRLKWGEEFEPVRVIGETNKTILVVGAYFGDSLMVTRQSKKDYFRSFEEAVKHRTEKLKSQIGVKRKTIEKIEESIERLGALARPNVPWEK